MKITIYSTTTCTYCDVLCQWLDKQGLTYDYKVTDEDAAAMREYLQVNDGIIGVPFTVIDNNGQVSKILGFDKPKLLAAIGAV